MRFNKKFAQNIFKSFFQSIYKFIYGNIEGIIEAKTNSNPEKNLITKDHDAKYNIYKIKNGRLYTDRINDTAIILRKNIVNGPSFQFRIIKSQIVNVSVKENIVFKKGTPRIKKKIKGKVLSLLTGGGGNDNYWHWLFDVLPRLGICENKIDFNHIDFFLLPDNRRKFQSETLKHLGIPMKKQISSVNFRHIVCDELYVTNHPVVMSENATEDIQNIPKWISEWLRKSFLKEISKKTFNKIYIDRGDSISNVSHLRSIINESEIKSYLSTKGFKILRLGDHTFNEQVSIFNNADIIVGLHGAGFANVIFCKKNTKIIELRNETAGKVIENLSLTNNLVYRPIICDQDKDGRLNQFGHIEVSINKLEEALK